MEPLVQGTLQARLAQIADYPAIHALRLAAFPRKDGRQEGWDAFDEGAWQIVVEQEGDILASYRLRAFASGAGLSQSYAAQFYDLAPLMTYESPILEIGRFCLADHPASFQVLRLAWGALTRIVDDLNVGLLIGCSSFKGADPLRHRAALALLGQGHIGPETLIPRPKALEKIDFPQCPFDRKEALMALPSVLRSYLGMGGWTSDHAVVDRDLDTLHVFTAVSVADIPVDRARLLRQIAQK